MSAKFVVTIEGLGGVHEDIDVPGEAAPETDDIGNLWFSHKGKTVRMFNSSVWRTVERVELMSAVEGQA